MVSCAVLDDCQDAAKPIADCIGSTAVEFAKVIQSGLAMHAELDRDAGIKSE